jgi:hypothetical protein
MVSLDATVPTRFSLLGGLAPFSLAHEDTAVPGRPLRCGGRYLRPALASRGRACASAEQQAVHEHYVDAAQLELSSVWTFLRLAQELAAVGAPASLVAAALEAAEAALRRSRGRCRGSRAASCPGGRAASRRAVRG